jgi:hypothetical protein
MGISNVASNLRPGICTSTTRPVAPYEGQMIYTTDLDTLEIWNGTAWRILAFSTPSSGSVLQVQSVTKTDSLVSALTGSPSDISGMTVNITPKSVNSKVLVTAMLNVSQEVSVNEVVMRMVRNSTAIFVGDAAGTRPRVSGYAIGATDAFGFRPFSFTHLDSPASTSAVTYKMQWWSTNGSGSAYLNRTQNDADLQFRPRAASSITVMEIAG